MKMRKDYDNDDNNDKNNDDGQRKHFDQKSSLKSMAQIGAKKPVKSRKTTQSSWKFQVHIFRLWVMSLQINRKIHAPISYNMRGQNHG